MASVVRGLVSVTSGIRSSLILFRGCANGLLYLAAEDVPESQQDAISL